MDEKVWTSRTSSNSSGKMESDICERILRRAGPYSRDIFFTLLLFAFENLANLKIQYTQDSPT